MIIQAEKGVEQRYSYLMTVGCNVYAALRSGGAMVAKGLKGVGYRYHTSTMISSQDSFVTL
jgi:hypothetical protein